MIILNGEIVEPTIFPDKTSQVWKVEISVLKFRALYEIEFHFESESEIFHLQQLVALIRECSPYTKISLHMPYLPYGRQDKKVSNDSTFALKVFCDILNQLDFRNVTTIDAHSFEAQKLCRNFYSIYPKKEIKFAREESKADTIAFPDKGACDRYNAEGYSVITGKKVRDQQTGYITKYTFDGDPTGKNILIIDDICDGGMTFIKLAEGLLKAEAKNVYLYVTHGIFSKGFKPLTDAGISRIFTKDGEILFLNKDEEESKI